MSYLADTYLLGLELHYRQQAEAVTDGLRSYNLGNGQGFSVQEVINIAGQVTGCDLLAEEADRLPDDTPLLVASNARVRQELGWKPQYSNLVSIISHAWTWHQRRFQ